MRNLKTQARAALLPILAAVFLCSCSDAPKSETKAPEKPPEPITGRHAFQMMYPQARGWAADAQPLQLRSINLGQVKSDKGKAGAWEATFISPSKAQSKTYTYSAVEADGNLHEGVFGNTAEEYRGGGASFPFLLAAIKTDSDQAYDTAAEKSADYIAKHPNMPVVFVLEQTRRYPDLTWRVVWGDSVGSSDYSVFVDASTAKLLAISH